MEKLIEKYEREIAKLKASEKRLLSYNEYEISESDSRNIDNTLTSLRAQKAIFESVILDLKFLNMNATFEFDGESFKLDVEFP